MTGGPRHRWRLAIGRPRTSTVVLIGLFLAVLALWVVVRPANVTSTTPTGNTQSTKGSPAGGSPAPTPTGTPAPSSPRQTQTPTPTTTATSQGGSPAP
ncbi:MAG: hypothetical protein J2P30_26215 [Actinobacteria bacterium]|nr:hypothetical protein [Actinomycetota bacterium]